MEEPDKGFTPKLEIGLELLETSLRCYFETKEYYSSLHLAGAAEEILGAHLTIIGEENSFRNTKRSTLAVGKEIIGTTQTGKEVTNFLNYFKNHTKHMNGIEDSAVGFSGKEEAYEILDRAISDFYNLMNYFNLSETELIRRFNQRLNAKD
ncbi:MAG: hypothetical protein LJE56_10795 [Acidiferrobacterales bacterium]|nr:hypothetical protein [Acidiferrobacterales bacterium]